jgi:prevent-host-death family protein
MKSVGIKQLKAHFSEYLREVRAGETVLVTEREEVIAELRPARRQARPADAIDEALDELAEAGEVTRAAQRKGRWTWRTRGLGLPEGTSQKILDALRDDERR